MTRNRLLKLLASAHLLANACFSLTAYADTLVYRAITDFPVIDAGAVPFYVDSARQALAINAAVEEYRDKFAQAQVVFDGQAGVFDMTIVGLAELDGSATYNLLVNDEIVGSASNPSVVSDYTPIRHTFEDVTVPDGAVLAVESLANSNDTIPEGDGYAFARGRWTTLELSPAGAAATPDNYVELSLAIISDKQTITVGQEFTLNLTTSNSANSIVATTPLVRVTLPGSGFSFVSGTNCSVISLLVECALPELAGGEQAQTSITLMATRISTSTRLNALVRAEQIDSYELNNSAFLDITVVQEPTVVEPDPATDSAPMNPTPIDQGEKTSGNEMTSAGLSYLWILLLPLWLGRQRAT